MPYEFYKRRPAANASTGYAKVMVCISDSAVLHRSMPDLITCEAVVAFTAENEVDDAPA